MIKQYPNFQDGGKNLESVCSYMNKIGNIGPVEFDHKLFLTRYITFCYNNTNVWGLTRISLYINMLL